MTQADLLAFPLLLAAIPAGTVLGVTGAGPGSTLRVVMYELCLRMALVGGALILAILARASFDASGHFAVIPLALLALEVGWALTSSCVPTPPD